MNDIQPILDATTYAVLATTREDGAPWATPVAFAYDDQFLYWMSPSSAVHTQNITRDNRTFVIIYDSTPLPKADTHGGVYLSSISEQLVGKQLEHGTRVYQTRFSAAPAPNAAVTLYRTPIGTLDIDKTSGERFYFKHEASKL